MAEQRFCKPSHHAANTVKIKEIEQSPKALGALLGAGHLGHSQTGDRTHGKNAKNIDILRIQPPETGLNDTKDQQDADSCDIMLNNVVAAWPSLPVPIRNAIAGLIEGFNNGISRESNARD